MEYFLYFNWRMPSYARFTFASLQWIQLHCIKRTIKQQGNKITINGTSNSRIRRFMSWGCPRFLKYITRKLFLVDLKVTSHIFLQLGHDVILAPKLFSVWTFAFGSLFNSPIIRKVYTQVHYFFEISITKWGFVGSYQQHF